MACSVAHASRTKRESSVRLWLLSAADRCVSGIGLCVLQNPFSARVSLSWKAAAAWTVCGPAYGAGEFACLWCAAESVGADVIERPVCTASAFSRSQRGAVRYVGVCCAIDMVPAFGTPMAGAPPQKGLIVGRPRFYFYSVFLSQPQVRCGAVVCTKKK